MDYTGRHGRGCLSLVLGVIGLVLALFLAGCGDSYRDLEGVKGKEPDKAEIFYNVDGFPNIVRICIDKVAFGTTTRDAQAAVFRVPEWDVPFCGATPR